MMMYFFCCFFTIFGCQLWPGTQVDVALDKLIFDFIFGALMVVMTIDSFSCITSIKDSRKTLMAVRINYQFIPISSNRAYL